LGRKEADSAVFGRRGSKIEKRIKRERRICHAKRLANTGHFRAVRNLVSYTFKERIYFF